MQDQLYRINHFWKHSAQFTPARYEPDGWEGSSVSEYDQWLAEGRFNCLRNKWKKLAKLVQLITCMLFSAQSGKILNASAWYFPDPDLHNHAAEKSAGSLITAICPRRCSCIDQ
ncbi:MAG: hypothetical protein IPH20_25110 [Bacteroidales bacterium]|nr:hypothetical protein [Bacteroidales bacterium]